MATYSRSIARITTTTVAEPTNPPAWRASMSATNMVYPVGETPSVVLPGRIQWPSAGAGNRLESGGDDVNPLYLASGYGGSVYVPEIGAWGTMIIGSTGEHALTEQLNSLGISEDMPSWNFFQQPLYATSTAGADAFNADWYYDPTYAASLPSSQQLDYSADATATAAWLSLWASQGSRFPIAYDGWIARRKFGANGGSTLLGNNRPHWFRYSMPCYIPASMTGTGAGALITNSQGTIYGPFNSGPLPSGATEADWYAEVWSSGMRKHWLHAMNVATKQWTRVATPVPATSGVYGLAHPQSAVDASNNRIYYSTNSSNGGNWALYYADFSAGLFGVTFAGPTNLNNLAGDTTTRYNSVLCIPATGALAGKRLWYFQDNVNSALILIDIGANTLRRLAVANLPPGDWRFGYDVVNNVVYLTTVDTSVVRCCRFVIPSDYTNAGAYSIQTLSIDMNGSSIETSANLSPYGQRSMYLPSLNVILIPQKMNQTLAFRPA
jgi:hypothetical protein